MRLVLIDHLVPSRRALLLGAVAGALLLGAGNPAMAEEVVNVYSSRHYDTDEALYENFTKQTGIKINRLEAKEDELLQRMKAEGDKSPADVLITVDAGACGAPSRWTCCSR